MAAYCDILNKIAFRVWAHHFRVIMLSIRIYTQEFYVLSKLYIEILHIYS